MIEMFKFAFYANIYISPLIFALSTQTSDIEADVPT